LQVLIQIVSFMAHIVLMRPQCYPTLVALELCGPEYTQESCVFRIEQAVTRVRQRIRRCTLIRAARFSDINQPTFFFIAHGFSVVCHWIDGIPESSMGFSRRYQSKVTTHHPSAGLPLILH
jgi:hypothetical protein